MTSLLRLIRWAWTAYSIYSVATSPLALMTMLSAAIWWALPSRHGSRATSTSTH